jgi:plastocyanin
VNLAASGVRFSTGSLSAPAGMVTISFSNNDDGISHNVHVYAGGNASSPTVGATATAVGPVQQTLNLGALAAGSYFYRCDVHPSQMSGTLTVAP